MKELTYKSTGTLGIPIYNINKEYEIMVAKRLLDVYEDKEEIMKTWKYQRELGSFVKRLLENDFDVILPDIKLVKRVIKRAKVLRLND